MGTKLFGRAGLMMFMLTVTGDLRAQPQTLPMFHSTYTFGSDNAVPGSALVSYCGALFGTSYSGGGNGSLYELTANPNFQYLAAQVVGFPGGNSGGNPYSDPLVITRGATSGIWLATQNGGNAGGGVLSYTALNGASSWIVHNFNSSTEGSQCQSPLAYFDVPNFPGYQGIVGTLTVGGSTNDKGAIFSIIISNYIQVKFSTITTYTGLNGSFPVGRLFLDAPISSRGFARGTANAATADDPPTFDLSSIVIYGVTKNGGSNGYGEVYSVNANGSNFMQLHAFNFGMTDGYSPQGGLERHGSLLYGTTSGGGANYAGTIFQINTNGTGYKLLFQFGSTNSAGSGPRGDLVLHHGTLYGTTYGGGTGGGGTVYSISTNGSNFTVLHSFAAPVYNGNGGYTNVGGGYSVQGLLYDNDVLYGVTPYGGSNGVGTAYEIVLPFKPRLAAARTTNGTLHLSWPSVAAGYALQKNTDLSTTNWSTNGLTSVDDGTNQTVTITPAGGKSFFRLIQ